MRPIGEVKQVGVVGRSSAGEIDGYRPFNSGITRGVVYATAPVVYVRLSGLIIVGVK